MDICVFFRILLGGASNCRRRWSSQFLHICGIFSSGCATPPYLTRLRASQVIPVVEADFVLQEKNGFLSNIIHKTKTLILSYLGDMI